MNKKVRMAVSLFAILLSGCAASAISVEEARKYAGLNVSEFLDKRFAGDGRVQRVNGTYRYKAFFAGSNIRFILRPATELRNFCTAQGGQPVLVRLHHGNPVGRFFTSPLMAGLQTHAYARSRGVDPGTAGRASLLAMQEQSRLNTYLGDAEARQAYAEAGRSGAFGTWECRDGAGSRKWAVSVLPVSFQPRTTPPGEFNLGKEGGGSAAILLEITPATQ